MSIPVTAGEGSLKIARHGPAGLIDSLARSHSGGVRQRWPNWSVEGRDRHQPQTLVAVGGLVTAVSMAVFGLPAVDLHGPLHDLGVMDPLCGGTRAARLAALGQWSQAWTYNPVGPVAVVAAAVMVLRAVPGLLWARWLNIHLSLAGHRRLAAVTVMVAAAIALEIRQQSLASLLQ